MIYTVVCALVLMDEASAYSGLGLTSIFGGTALCMVGIQVIACKTNYLASYDQKFISNEVRTRSDSQDDELLKEEKTDDTLPHSRSENVSKECLLLFCYY